MWREVKVLLMDEDESRRHDMDVILNFLGESVVASGFGNWQSHIEEYIENTSEISCVLLGSSIPDSSNSTEQVESMLDQISEWDSTLPVILLANTSKDLLSEEYQNNVIANIATPPSYNKLQDSLHRAQVYREHYDLSRGREQGRNNKIFRSLVGASGKISRVREMMGQVADKDVTVLITGASGTGKEVVARNLHYNSPRKDEPFVPVNCGAIPAELLESELFGHEKGSFTGAISTRQGRCSFWLS